MTAASACSGLQQHPGLVSSIDCPGMAASGLGWVQVKELRTQNERLEDLFEDSCAKRQAADSKLAQLRRVAEADKAAHAKQVCRCC